MRSLLLLFVVVWLSATCRAARILAVIPTPSISHQLPFRPIALELVRRGHHVTLITTDPIKKKIENYIEIDVSHSYEYFRSTFDFTAMSEVTPIDMIDFFLPAAENICKLQLESSQFQDFLRHNQSFDLIILEHIIYPCYYGLVHKLGSPPMIGFLSLGVFSFIHPSYGNPNNPAYCPDLMLPYSDHMTFWQRLYNTYVQLRYLHMWNFRMAPSQEKIKEKYFGSNLPSVFDTDRNFSLLLINSHFNINYPRPYLPNLVELTGLHLDKTRKPLPKNIQKFLDGAEHGVIYFSLGSNVKSSTMTEEKRRAFLEAFSELPQRVLWKWEADSLPGQPDNVMVAKWLPQQDVLAHPKIRLFITQGGLQSFNEAAYNGVPFVGIPFIGDQPHNVGKMVSAGIGYKLEFKDVTKESVLKAIRTVLVDPSYHENMRRFSAVFREHQEESLDKAVWWIEYVIRHNGARHLRSAALDLYWWQYLLLDVVAFVMAAVGIAIFTVYKATRFVLGKLRLAQKFKKQ